MRNLLVLLSKWQWDARFTDIFHDFKTINCSLIELAAWLQRFADWETVVKPDLLNIIRYYRSQGVEEFAIFGMCWGGRIGTSVAIELSDYFKASGIVHPSNVDNSEAPSVRIPMYLLPSSAQPDMVWYLTVNFCLRPFFSYNFDFTFLSCHSTKCFEIISATTVATDGSMICIMDFKVPEAISVIL